MKRILKAGRLIDGNGGLPIPDAAVVVENESITKVSSQNSLSESDTSGAEIIDIPNGSLMPGFIEMHSHIHCSAQADAYTHITTENNETFLMRGTQAVRSALCSGVTTMRDLGSRNEVVFPLRNGISEGIIPGPRLLVAGTPITTTGGHCNMFGTEANTTEEVVKAVRQQFKLGADHIKIMSTGGGFTPGTNVRAPQYSSETLKAAVEDGKRLGLMIAAHCHATEGVRNCVEAGRHCDAVTPAADSAVVEADASKWMPMCSAAACNCVEVASGGVQVDAEVPGCLVRLRRATAWRWQVEACKWMPTYPAAACPCVAVASGGVQVDADVPGCLVRLRRATAWRRADTAS